MQPKTDYKELITNSRWALKLTWSTQPALLLAVIGFNLAQSLMPAGLALAIRGLINSVSDLTLSPNDDTTGLYLWLGAGLILTIAAAVSGAATNYFTNRMQDELNLQVTSDILDHISTLDYAYFEDPQFQDILNRANANTGQKTATFITIIIDVVSNVIQIVSLIAIIAVIEPILLLLILPFAIPFLIYQMDQAKKRFAVDYARAVKRRWTRYYLGHLTDDQLVAETKLLGLAPLFSKKLYDTLAEFRDQDSRFYRFHFIGNVAFAALSTVMIYFAFGRVAFNVIGGVLTIGDVTIYAGAAVKLRTTIESTVLTMRRLRSVALEVSNLRALLELKPQNKSVGDLTPAAGFGEIEVKSVSFTYPGASRPTLSNVSLHIKPGETVAIVGENGAGKTTLVKLITRLYDPDRGVITFDGNDMRALSPEFLQRQISFVFQNFGRYEATVADNVAYGNWRDLLHQQDEIEQLTGKAGMADMIKAMPQGYDTMLGRKFGEYSLSGGQWQKIAITRAFARNSSLLILDEPTASLDVRSEFELFTRFKELASDRTTILISHRFSTVSMADRILVMNNGQIIENGTHAELMAQNGVYAALYKLHQEQMGVPVNGKNGI